jgi:hypothetical protein
MPTAVTPRQAALWWASHGYPVLPLHSIGDGGTCTCGDTACHSPGKHPFARYVPHGLKDATVDSAAVKAWFEEHYWLNYGICTDALLVIDVDVKHKGLETWADMCGQPTRALIHTWQARTGSGGLHVFFKPPEGARCGELDRGIDIRATGGYVVGVGSKHATGRAYGWASQCSPKDAPLAEIPDWLTAVISSRTYLGKVTPPQEWRRIAGTMLMDGERNKTITRLAGHLISNPLNDPLEVRELLLGWNRGRCEPPLDDKCIISLVERLCERERNKQRWL